MNIYDISQKAGVSIATVSRVLNGSEKVSEKNPKKSACCHGRKQLHTKCLCQKSRTEFHAHCWDSLFRLLGRLPGTGNLLSGAGASQEFLCIHALLHRV